MKKRRILFIASEFTPGMIPFASSIINTLAENKQWEIHAILVNSGKHTYAGKVTPKAHVIYVEYPQAKWRKLLYKFYPRRIIKAIQEIDHTTHPDIIHLLTGDFALTPYMMFKRDERFYYTVHDLHPHEVNRMRLPATLLHHYIVWGYKILHKRINNLTTCSLAQYDELRCMYRHKHIGYTHFPTLVTDPIKQGGLYVNETQETTGYILFFGNVNRYKGVDLLVKAFEQSTLPGKCKLVIAGKGEDYHGEHIIRINRFIEDGEIRDLFEKAALVVYPYRSATMSGVLSLAYFFHKPVLASSIPFFREYANNHTTLFANSDVDDLKSKLEDCYQNQAIVPDASDYNNIYSAQTLTDDYARLYTSTAPKSSTYILYDNADDNYTFISKHIGSTINEVYSPKSRHKLLTWLRGCIQVLRVSQRHDTIVCWFDFQAVICYWLCKLCFLKRRIIGINLMLKDKKSLKNKFASYLYKQALLSPTFQASVTSAAYGQWLNRKLGITRSYPVIHDVFREQYTRPYYGTSTETQTVFCGGRNGRDWQFMLDLAHAMPHVHFTLVVPRDIHESYKGLFPANLQVHCDIAYPDFMRLLCESAFVCLPLNTEAPAGLIVLFQAAANRKMVITTDTVTTQEYIAEDRGVKLPNNVEAWKQAIEYYREHPAEASEKATNLYDFLQTECSEAKFTKGLKNIINS